MTLSTGELLQWYLEAGVDETVAESPRDYFAENTAAKPAAPPKPEPVAAAASAAPPAPKTSFLPPAAAEAIAEARALADRCATRAELEEAVRGFNGLAIKKTANKTVFSDGNPEAKIMLIGEAPGAQEDLQGIPFCGPSGQLLDRMFAAIGLDRTQLYISNTLFWRPPGNRQPSAEELAICEPFVEKHIALMAPRLLILAGGTATASVLKRDQSIGRLRGRFYDYSNRYMPSPVPVAVFFHPSYLLRSPQQKRLAWADLQMIQGFLPEKSA